MWSFIRRKNTASSFRWRFHPTKSPREARERVRRDVPERCIPRRMSGVEGIRLMGEGGGVDRHP
jgi:hypothetical protein